MADDFLLAGDPYAPPLDVGQAPTQPAARPPMDKRQLLKMALILGAAARGGRGALQGALTGINQARAQRQAEAQRQQQQAQLDAYRRQTLAQAEARNRQIAERERRDDQQRFLTGLPGAISGFESQESVRAMLPLYRQQASQLGLDPNQIEGAVLEGATPSAMQKRQAEKYIGKMKGTYGDDWMERTSGFTHMVGGEALPIEEVLRRAELPGVSPKAATDKRGFTPRDITFNGRRMSANYDPDTGEYYAVGDTTTPLRGEIQEYQRPPSPPVQVTLGGSGLTPQQVTAASTLRDDFRTESKDFYAARDGYERLLAAASDPSPAGDLALIYGYMKILDPNSVVRETEFAQAARAGSLPQQIQATALRLVNGERLTAAQRQDFLARAQRLFASAQKRHDARRTSYSDNAKSLGVPESFVIGNEPPVDESAITPPPTAPPRGNPYRGRSTAAGPR